MESSSLKFTRPYVTVISPDIDLDERKMVLFFPPNFTGALLWCSKWKWLSCLAFKKTFKETTLVTLKGRISLTLNKEVQTSGEDSSLEHQLEGDALVEAISLLAHTGVEENHFWKDETDISLSPGTCSQCRYGNKYSKNLSKVFRHQRIGE